MNKIFERPVFKPALNTVGPTQETDRMMDKAQGAEVKPNKRARGDMSVKHV